MATSTIPYQSIMKEEGVSDLRTVSLKCLGRFAKALYVERQAGHSTPEALTLLDEAIQAETEALAK